MLAKEKPSFGLIRDVAEVHKHVKLNRRDRVLTSAGQTGIGAMGWGEAEYGVGIYGGAEELVVDLDSGVWRHFLDLVNDVFTMWQSKLTSE